MTKSQGTIWNRTAMHSGVRSATELLQQEVGQAGRITLPAGIVLNAAVGVVGVRTLTLTSTTNVFPGELLTIGTGSMAACTADCPETVKVISVNSTTQITADSFLGLWLGEITPGLQYTHLSGAPVSVFGGFASGIVPADYPTSPSTGWKLKLYGDINADGTMVYIEYFCDTPPGTGNLYRTMMIVPPSALAAVPAKPTPPGPAEVLLSNLQQNPNNAPCFVYQPMTVGAGVNANTFITDVAITLTVQSQQRDPVTKQYQLETKALLNVSPRNVVNVWQFASAGGTERIQPMPPMVLALLP
jgi:hypothetical protein